MWTIAVSSILVSTCFVALALSKENSNSTHTIKPAISDFKARVHHIFEGARIRSKRQLEESDPLNYKLRFESPTPLESHFLSNYKMTFWMPVQLKEGSHLLIGTTEGHIRLFRLLDENYQTANEVAESHVEHLPVKAEVFTHLDEQWFAVLHDSGSAYYIQMYQRIGRGLEKRQKIDLPGFSDLQLITMKGINYIVVSSYSSRIGQSFTHQASVTLYHWTQTQFDEIVSRTTYGARSVDCWILDGSLYIAVAQEVNDEGNAEVGSPIFLYNSKEENKLVLWQALETVGPSKVQHFYVAGSQYLVVIGRQDAVIYWWSSGQFLKWQTLSHTAGASDVSVLALGDGEVAIVIALQEEALFYTLDSSGLYVIVFSMSLGGSSLRSLQFMSRGKAYYALALFGVESRNSIWKLTLSSHYLPSIQSLDPLQQCLLDTQQLLKEQKKELDAIKLDVNRVWLKGSNQNITTKVIVKGNIISNGSSKVRDIIIVRYANVPHASMSHVIDELMKLNELAEDAKNELDGAVLKSNRQEIRGFKHFKDPIFVPSSEMEEISNDLAINDVQISRLQNHGLRKTGDQVFLNSVSVSDLHSDAANVSTLNGISIDDFLLLDGMQKVTGNLAFSDVSATDMVVGFINSIPVQDMIITNTPQDIRSLKIFADFKSHSIDVHGETNEVDLGSTFNKIATVDGYNNFLGSLTFPNTVTVNGSMFVSGKINKIVDISRLVDGSVKRYGQQYLAGRYTFKGKQTIDDDLLIGGHINKVSLDNLMTLASDQKIYADATFSEAITVQRDLLVDVVNGADLSEQALSRDAPYQFITGRKIFAEDITADFVDMTDYITLDGVDPSFLVQNIVQHNQGVVKQNATVLKDVEVLNNLNVMGGINGIDIADLHSSVWLKSAEQTITMPVESSYLHFKSNLYVKTANELDLDLDVVHSYRDEVIEAQKQFDFKTVVESLNTSGTINGVDVNSLKIELDRQRNEWEIQGTKEISSFEIKGNLAVVSFNELDVSDIMRPNAQQTVRGPVEFADGNAYIQGDVKSSEISFEFFNGLNLKEYVRNAVLKHGAHKSLINKHFKHLKADSVTVASNSTISGVSFHELLQKAVTLNTRQVITAPKIFASTVNFNNLISATTVNGLVLNDYINEVVLTDEVSKISHKTFLGDIQTTNAFVSGVINGINIADMAANIFYKSEDNVVNKPFIFKGDITADDLYAPEIDGIPFTNLTFLKNDEELDAGWFLSNVRAERDVFVTGLINGCDLSQISSSLYANRSTQFINKNIDVHNVVIQGNLIVTDTLNRIPLENLQNLITTSEDQIIASDVVIDASLVVDQINLVDSENSDLAFILKDAARHSIAQEIRGRKEFKDGMDATNLLASDVVSLKVNGVDMEELKRTTVWKNGHQKVVGEKIFSILHASVVLISGYLNGLKLPEDVVRSDVSEHITHPTFFMSDVYVLTDLVVHGLIDRVHMNELIHGRVTLNSEQNLTAALTFNDDVIMYDELKIDGTINDIVLDLVVKVKPEYPIQGYKIFKEFHVSGAVTVASINGFDMDKLKNSILQYNKNEHIHEIQVFEKPIIVQNSIIVDWINNIPIRQLTTAFTAMMDNIQSVLGFLQDLSFNLQQQLSLQMSVTQDTVSKFAYFTLFQELDVGPTSRILLGYNLEHSDSQFSHSLVMWTEEKRCVFMEKCCHLEFSYWLRIKKSGVAIVDGSADPGRYYPIQNFSPVVSERDFFIWTNATDFQPEWCASKNERMILGSNNEDKQEVYFDSGSSTLLSDVKAFREGYLYAVASFYIDPQNGEYGSTVVYMYDGNRHWSEHQVLPSFGVLSLDVTSYFHEHREDILLALGTGMNTEPVSYSSVYKWNKDSKTFDLLQDIASRYITSTLWIEKGRDLLLSMSGVDYWPKKAMDCSEAVSGGQIDIYSYKENGLKWIQSIPVGGVISMASFSVDGDTFLAAGSIQHEIIYIFQWKGYSGFVQIQTISADVRHLNIYIIDDDVYMTVASVSGSSKILKMNRKGKSSFVTNFDLSLEQKDEIPKLAKITGC